MEGQKTYMSTEIEQSNKRIDSLQDAIIVINNIQNAIQEHSYYSVYYDKTFYAGKFTKVMKSEVCVKFLEYGAGNLHWSKWDRIETIKIGYIFYGPINLNGVHSFTENIQNILV